MSKISELSDGGVIQGGDTLIAVRSGGNVKVTYGGTTTANIDGGTIDGTTIGGTTPAAGNFTTGSFTADVSFGDNDKAIFGAGSDLEIYSDGSTSYIREAGPGNLRIAGANVQITDASFNKYFLGSGDVARLYHSDDEVLATTSTGIDVTGTVTADGLTVDGDVSISDSVPILRLDSPAVTWSGGEDLGGIDWYTEDTSGNGPAVMARIYSESSGTNTLPIPNMIFQTSVADVALKDRMRIDGTGDISFYDTDGSTASFVYDASAGLTINEAGADRDFRVESDSNANMLFVDGGLNHVNIGTATDLGGTLNVDDSIYVAQTDTPRIRLRNTGNSDTELGINGLGAGLDSFYIAQYAGIAANEYDFRIVGASREFTFARGGVVNEGGADSDFRVESDSNTHMLFVNAGSNRVGVGEPLPGDTLQLNGGNIVNPNSTGSEITSATFGVGGNIHLEERQPNGAYSDRTDLVIVTNTGFGAGESEKLRLAASGAITTYPVANAETVFNESGVDADFRVESDTNANVLFIDGGTGYLCIGANVNRPDSSGTLSQSHSFVDGKHYVYSISDFGVWASNSAGTKLFFRDNTNSTIGSISYDSGLTGVSYNTSSDARLKENIADAKDAGALIDAIQVRQFDWIKSGEHQRYGMVAQELNTVAPEAVSEGETEEDMMAVDYSKLVPMLVKEIQSLRARVSQLESN